MRDALLLAAGLICGIAGGIHLMRAGAYILPEFRDRAGGSRALLHAEWYAAPGQRLLRRGYGLQLAAVAIWLLAAAT